MCDQVVPLSTWNKHKISPTYLSTNLMTPLQIPFRDTVPRSHIIAEGTGRRFPRLEWGSFMTNYGGIGKLPFLGKTRNQYGESLLLPRSHRHYLSSCGKMIHGVVQPSKITCLLKSKLRQHDEFIVQPCRCKERQIMNEDNHFIQEPCYSSHRPRSDMFPKNRAEHNTPIRPHDFRQKTPLCDVTRQELEDVVRRRYKISSYANHYQLPCPSETVLENPIPEHKKCLQPSVVQQQSCSSQSNEISNDQGRITGLWPCWPAGNNYIVCNVTGQIVEKRDVNSLDDCRDYRTYKMAPICTNKQEESDTVKKDPSSQFRSYSSSDYVPLPYVDIYGCGPGRIGGGNTDREIPCGVYCQAPSNETKNDIEDRRPYPRAHPVKTHCQTCQSTCSSGTEGRSYKHLQYFDLMTDWKERRDVDDSMRLRWVENEKMSRLRERIAKCKCLNTTEEQKEEQKANDKADLSADIPQTDDEEEVAEEKSPETGKRVTFCEKVVSDENLAEKRQKLHVPVPQYFSAASVEHAGRNSPVSDDSMVSLELHRDTETVSNLLASIDKAESAKLRAASVKIPCIAKNDDAVIDPTNDPTSVFYRPPMKLPPDPLWTTLQYDGNRIPDRLGVRFKTVALKRYHAIHPETIPDLRDFRPPLRRSKFLGYHTSVFR